MFIIGKCEIVLESLSGLSIGSYGMCVIRGVHLSPINIGLYFDNENKVK